MIKRNNESVIGASDSAGLDTNNKSEWFNKIIQKCASVFDTYLNESKAAEFKIESDRGISIKLIKVLKNEVVNCLNSVFNELAGRENQSDDSPHDESVQFDGLQELDELRRNLADKNQELAEKQRNLLSLRTDERSLKAKLVRLERQTNIKNLLDDCLLRFLSDMHSKAESATDLEKLKEAIVDLEESLFYDLKCNNIEILKFDKNAHLDNDDYKFADVSGSIFADNDKFDHCVQELNRYGAVIKGETDDQTEIIKAKVIIYVKK